MNIYDFSVENINGDFVSLREYEGKVILIVNSATRCGFTPQYDDLEMVLCQEKVQVKHELFTSIIRFMPHLFPCVLI